jgi:hypothetical protein
MNATSQPGTNASIEVTICVYAIIKRGYFGKLFPESQMVGCKCQGSWSTAKVFSKMHKCVQVFLPTLRPILRVRSLANDNRISSACCSRVC